MIEILATKIVVHSPQSFPTKSPTIPTESNVSWFSSPHSSFGTFSSLIKKNIRSCILTSMFHWQLHNSTRIIFVTCRICSTLGSSRYSGNYNRMFTFYMLILWDLKSEEASTRWASSVNRVLRLTLWRNRKGCFSCTNQFSFSLTKSFPSSS